jgi:hypothetical protein
MEPLWSPVVATGGNQWQIDEAQKRRKQAKTIAVDCDQLPKSFHGKGALPTCYGGGHFLAPQSEVESCEPEGTQELRRRD